MYQPVCINIGCDNLVTYSATYKNGTKRWRPVCNWCHRASYGAQQLAEGVQATKKKYCENIDSRLGYKCTTTIPYPGALEIDHMDGDRENNIVSNVQTLCKVCHSYKGHINNDFKKDRQKQKEMLV
jgi:hypothetical protein